MKSIVCLLVLVFIASKTLFSQDINSEILELRSIISENPNTEESAKLLIKVFRLYIKTNQRDEAYKYCESIQKEYKGNEIEAVSICITIPKLLRADKFDEVKTKCLYVRKNFKGSSWAAESLYNLGEMYLNVYEDKATADKYFKELVEDCPGSGLVKSAKLYLGG